MDPSDGIEVITRSDQAAALVHGDRRRVLSALREPGSATTVARRIGLSRQRVNYHLRELEAVGLVRLVEKRRKRNCIERVVQATARRYVISGEALDELGVDAVDSGDRFSSSVLLGMAAKIVRDVGLLRVRARAAGRRLATFSLGTEVRFRSASDRNRFAEELATAVAELVARYHDDDSPDGRRFRVVAGVHPAIADEGSAADSRGGHDER